MTARRPAGSRRAARAQRGSGTVLALGLIAVVLLALVAVTAVGQVALARSQSRTAADLAALASAGELHGVHPASAGGPCGRAERTARANGATEANCRIEGETTRVEARVAVRGPWGWGRPAHAVARAGPA